MLLSGSAFRIVARLGFCLSLAWLPHEGMSAQAPEFRAWWVDAFHAGFRSSAEVTDLINNIRAANCNAVLVEIRKRGDAYYSPNTGYADYEPHAADTTPANFDSLADLIAKAHDTSGGKARVEVHAWIVTWPVWGSTTPPTTSQHPFNRHPEWLTQDITGATWNGNQYCLDPGHPGAQTHIYRLAMNLATNYDLDGLNFDYVRYAGNTWGYNLAALSRYRARFGGSGLPSPTDLNWLQFRRDQVTALVRKVYLNAIAAKPGVKISADTITWAPGPANLGQWYSSSAAWNNVLQDWRGWMEEGILDLNIPMAYFDEAGPFTTDWTNWCNFTRDYQYGRYAAIGAGTYLNSTDHAIAQLRYTHQPSPKGNYAKGLCGYSYAVADKMNTLFATFLAYLTNSPNANDPLSPALFAQSAPVPPLPWKSAPRTGHLMGTVYASGPANPLDGAVVTVMGPVFRTQTNDATGFYGFVDLPPGVYSVRATIAPLGSVTNALTIVRGAVSNCDLLLPLFPRIASQPGNLTVKTGSNIIFSVSATGAIPLKYQWLFQGSTIPGATASAYSRSNVQTNDAGSYHVMITNTAGTITSSPAILTVIPLQPPVIISQPRSLAAVVGGKAAFSVAAQSSTSLRFQWRLNGGDLHAQTNSTLSLPKIQSGDFGAYTVLLANDDGLVLSETAELRPAAPPAILAATNLTAFTLTFSTEFGPIYCVEYKDKLEAPEWQPLTNIAGSGQPASATDGAATGQARFYRVHVQ